MASLLSLLNNFLVCPLLQASSKQSKAKAEAKQSAKCFFQLRQLRRIRRSLDDDSVATLVHAFIASRVDYCSSLLIGAPKKTTDKVQRVLNSAARIVSNRRKFDRGLNSFPAKSATLAGRCRPGSVQSLPTLQTGTHFLLTLETIVFLFHLLGASSKPFSSLSTSRLAHAARLGFFFYKKTRYKKFTVIINSLLLSLYWSLILFPFYYCFCCVYLVYMCVCVYDCLSAFWRIKIHMNIGCIRDGLPVATCWAEFFLMCTHFLLCPPWHEGAQGLFVTDWETIEVSPSVGSAVCISTG